MLQRSLRQADHVIIIASRLPDAVLRLLQRQEISFLVRKLHLIDIGRKGLRHAVGKLLLFLCEPRAGGAEVPFISLVRDVKIGNGAPAHGALDRITDSRDCSDLLQIGIIERAVAGGAEDGALGAAAAHADAENVRRCARKGIPVIADVADRRLQIRHAEGRPVVPASAPCKGHHHAFVRIVRHAPVPEGTVIAGGRRHGRVARRVDRKDHGSIVRSIVSDRLHHVHLAGEGPVAIVLRVKKRARHKEAHGLIRLICRLFTVSDPDLPVDIIVRVVLPLRHIDQGKVRDRRIRCRLLLCPGSSRAVLLFRPGFRRSAVFCLRRGGCFRTLCLPALRGRCILPCSAAARKGKDRAEEKGRNSAADLPYCHNHSPPYPYKYRYIRFSLAWIIRPFHENNLKNV